MELDDEETGSKKLVALFILAVVVISGAIIWFVGGMLSEPIEPPKKTVQEIKVIRPPPPPPEIEEEPPPPEPEIEEEVDIPEPEEIPDVPDLEPPPGEQLGLDAEGGAGSDAFGLLGNKGGRSLISGGGGDRFAWYGKIVQTNILDSLYKDEKLRSLGWQVRCDIWLNKSGEISRYKILNSTGNLDIDARIEKAVSSVLKISDKPPNDIPMPIKMVLRSR